MNMDIATKEKMDPRSLLSNVNEKIAGILPINTGSVEYKDMHLSIIECGQQTPVIVHLGMLCDGRHRAKACLMIGIKVEAYVVPDSVSESDVEDYITNEEFITKKISTTQKTIIAYERYVIGRRMTHGKVSKKAGVKSHNLGYYKYILDDEYAISRGYVEDLKNGKSVRLPNKKWSNSLLTVRNSLLEYNDAKGSLPKETAAVDYARAFAEYDTDGKIEDMFWAISNETSLSGIDENITLIYELIRGVYQDRYDFESEITPSKIRRIVVLYAEDYPSVVLS